jgi:transcriptional regulator with XRE-family HTH domain
MEVTISDRDAVRQASLRLPKRQRAALELRERKGLSYEQIAATLGTSPGSVAQLIERGRINLYDELRGTALASVAAPSVECERALPLIAARQDEELASSSEDAVWLDAHLSGCDRCRLAAEQMGEATAFYRDEAGSMTSRDAPQGSASSAGSANSSPRFRGRGPNRRQVIFAGGVAALAATGVVVALAADGGSSGAASSKTAAAGGAGFVQRISDARVVRPARDAEAAPRHSAGWGAKSAGVIAGQAGSSESVAISADIPSQGSDGARGGSGSGPGTSPGAAAVQPATPKPAPKPKSPHSSSQASQPTATPVSEPVPSPPPAEEATPPAEEPTAEHGHKGEPPGKPADRPPRK